ncbi:MAG: hypothetical protein APG12_01663 [Candidatus Methanofastidiosum methylothiophilum]|uniref:Nucleotidyl transferase AbiEii toxin, Type IV TA system n=1 Tax=Candidatus Methanofastidiosum methylothiophilum TaxID=1705564 RepID=A0A150IWU1_9EURY|nr:MAG: hypothetical protein APG10_01675 [Candidatus Methanofastidiosum methylthiophilus]KYC46694.1 MAG: hypothetical protein APG11_01736 [Candidatus Methanofastidiosum methylthiophilus]KYC49134.1 MAG: hypothetical protein APG12_01663 [Candidatus Methanofastidiosum methylthiophilus]
MREFLDYVSGRLEISNKFLLEKDIIIHRLLLKLSKTDFFKEFIFKGGTCLIKCYYGYYRFSEDLDFTYRNQEDFPNKSQKEVRKILSKNIDKTGEILSKISSELNIRFIADKSDDRYIEFGGSNKFVTFKLWYDSELMETEQFIKIQINFVEKLLYKEAEMPVTTLVKDIPKKEIDFLYPEYTDLLENIKIPCYDIKEILVEKARAILTRRVVKSRDFIDIYMISSKDDLDIKSFEDEIIDKTMFMLQYSKYVKNISALSLEKFILGEEEKILLNPLDETFKEYLKILIPYLNSISEKVRKKLIPKACD